MNVNTRYPSFNVLDEKDEWDDHTQQIVTSRTHPIADYQFLNEREVGILRFLCSLLVNDDSPDSSEFVIGHFDQTLYSSPGEGQRKADVPAAPELIRQGLKAIEQTSQHKYSVLFYGIEHRTTKADNPRHQRCKSGTDGGLEWNASAGTI